MSLLKKSLKAITPYGLVKLWQVRHEKRISEDRKAERVSFHAERRLRIEGVQDKQDIMPIQGDDYQQVVDFLKSRLLDEAQILKGSVPQNSLEYIRENAIMRLDEDRPLMALHVGNFVGVSLAFLSSALKQRHSSSLVVAVDPNLTHRGISNPQAHVSALLTACALQRNTMIIAGYSGKKSISNDGVIIDDYDPQREFFNECACEEILKNLTALCQQTFDLILMDGNHEAVYLGNEVQTALPLLRSEGFIVLDDVSADWTEIAELFSIIETFGLKKIGTDGRVGIARLDKHSSINKCA